MIPHVLTSAGANSKQSYYSAADSQGGGHKKVYFQQELKRLRTTLEREGSKIQKPQRCVRTVRTHMYDVLVHNRYFRRVLLTVFSAEQPILQSIS